MPILKIQKPNIVPGTDDQLLIGMIKLGLDRIQRLRVRLFFFLVNIKLQAIYPAANERDPAGILLIQLFIHGGLMPKLNSLQTMESSDVPEFQTPVVIPGNHHWTVFHDFNGSHQAQMPNEPALNIHIIILWGNRKYWNGVFVAGYQQNLV